MKRPFAAAALALWLIFLGAGIYWVARPYFWSERNAPGTTMETARREFRVHLAKFPQTAETRSPLLRVGEEEVEEAEVDIAVRSWLFRETRNRFFVAFGVWMAAGFFLRWLLGRMIRGEDTVEQ